MHPLGLLAIVKWHSKQLRLNRVKVGLDKQSGMCLPTQVVEAGVVDALMQMQSISYCGAFRQPAAELLRTLAADDSAVRDQMLTAVVKQPAGTTPADWARWWEALQQELGLVSQDGGIAPVDGASL